MNIQRTQGFTLPQLLVATAIGGILLLSVGMLVNTGLNAQTSETSQTAAKTAIRRINDNIASTVRSGSFGVMEKLNSKAATMVFLNQAGAYSVANSASFRNNDSLTLQGSEALDLSSGERVMLINNVGDAVMMNVTSVAGRTITHDCKNTIPFTANTRLFKTTSYGVALGSALGTSYNASSLYEMVGGTWSEIAYDVTDFSLRTLYRDTANNTIVVDPADASSYAGLSPAFIPEAPTSARGRVPNVPNVTARSGTEYNLYALAVTTTKTGVSGGDTLNRAYGEQMPLTSDSSSPVKKLYNCAGGSDVGTDSGGTLYVGVNNAPAPTTVTVSGPSAWSRSVSSTQTFENLQNGTYTGTAPDVTYNTYETWRARWTSNPSTVNSWTGARMIAQYERLPGTLNVQIDGLPAGVDASNALSLNGPSGYTRSSWNNGANTITDAPPGEYNVNVGDVQSGLATYRGAATPTSVGLYSGAAQTITVSYGVVNGTLNIRYNPNGRGQTTISVTGPDGYSTSITTAGGTSTLSVPPGVYSAVSTYGTGNSPINVASSSTRTITITAPSLSPPPPPPTGGLPTSGSSATTSSSYEPPEPPTGATAPPGTTGSGGTGTDAAATGGTGSTTDAPPFNSGTAVSGPAEAPTVSGTDTTGAASAGDAGSTGATDAFATSGDIGNFDGETSSTTTTGGNTIVARTDGELPDIRLGRVGSYSSGPARVCSTTHSTRPAWLNRLLDGLHVRC